MILQKVHLYPAMIGPFLYRCPNTGLYVQGWSESEALDLLSYESVTCLVCERLHMVNVKTGRVAGAAPDEP